MRPIDADALIEVVEKSMAENPHKEKTQRAMHTHEHKYFLTLLAGIPTIQPEPQWIPVGERLPEKGGEYLVSVHHTIGAISVFHPEKDTYVDDVAIMKYYGKFPSTVRAWMPLPEAYKPNKK